MLKLLLVFWLVCGIGHFVNFTYEDSRYDPDFYRSDSVARFLGLVVGLTLCAFVILVIWPVRPLGAFLGWLIERRNPRRDTEPFRPADNRPLPCDCEIGNACRWRISDDGSLTCDFCGKRYGGRN